MSFLIKAIKSTAREPGKLARWTEEKDSIIRVSGCGYSSYPEPRKYISIEFEVRDRRYRLDVDKADAEAIASSIFDKARSLK